MKCKIKIQFLFLLFLLFSACKTRTTSYASTNSVTIYQTTSTYDGDDLAGLRTNAQTACADSAVSLNLTCTNATEAMLGFSAFDVADIDDIPSYPDSAQIANIDGFVVADNFADLIDDRDRLFTNNGLAGTGMSIDNVWTGFLNGGLTETSFNCDNWSQTTGSTGTFSPTLSATGNWQGAIGCTNARPFLCLCW